VGLFNPEYRSDFLDELDRWLRATASANDRAGICDFLCGPSLVMRRAQSGNEKDGWAARSFFQSFSLPPVVLFVI
jgi:hypothetical protein